MKINLLDHIKLATDIAEAANTFVTMYPSQVRYLIDRAEKFEADNAELRGRLFSLTCKECGDNLKSLYCPSCGRPMAQVVGQEYPSYAELRKRVKELEELSRKALNALVWCGGSNDFAPEGKARLGWENVVVPVMQDAHTILVELPTSKSEGAGAWGSHTVSKFKKDTETR